ncbi:MAG: hypothetical protein ACE361_22855 [Aureliella sp.]
MAPRLTVVVSQSAQKNPIATDLEETLVAELMMKGGMDATMIGPLQHIQTNDTDFLCLSSFNYNFALVSWLPANETQQQLDRLGMQVQVVSLAGPEERSDGKGQRVLHLQLGSDTKLPVVMSTLGKLLAERAVKPVGISGIGVRSSAASPSAAVGGDDQSVSSPGEPLANENAETQGKRQASTSSALETALESSGADVEDEEWEHLEQLVDDLDDADL